MLHCHRDVQIGPGLLPQAHGPPQSPTSWTSSPPCSSFVCLGIQRHLECMGPLSRPPDLKPGEPGALVGTISSRWLSLTATLQLFSKPGWQQPWLQWSDTSCHLSASTTLQQQPSFHFRWLFSKPLLLWGCASSGSDAWTTQTAFQQVSRIFSNSLLLGPHPLLLPQLPPPFSQPRSSLEACSIFFTKFSFSQRWLLQMTFLDSFVFGGSQA